MRIFRQTAIGRWSEVLEQIEQELEAMAAAQHLSPAFVLPEARAAALRV
jgi:alkanesulfonate monooxygenase SsuD/methylene tetrahydromethanopterin reductase-like flavin-dependent oxidoreductase (luciferase family)